MWVSYLLGGWAEKAETVEFDWLLWLEEVEAAAAPEGGSWWVVEEEAIWAEVRPLIQLFSFLYIIMDLPGGQVNDP